MTNEDAEVLYAMKRFGGSFMTALANAAWCADSVNLAKIKGTWPDEWRKYEAMAKDNYGRQQTKH